MVNKYCCTAFEACVLHNYVWKGAQWMIDTGLDGDLEINFCPWCGANLQAPNLPKNTNNITSDGRYIDGT